MPEAPARTALYRLYDAEGRLLYIGITRDPDARWKEHQYWERGTWAPLVAKRTVRWHRTSEALAIEAAAIRAEKPIHNVAHNFDHVPFPCAHWPCLADAGRQKAIKLARLIRAEIDSGNWLEGHKIPAPKEMAELVGIGLGATIHAIQKLRREGVVYRFRSFGHFVSER